MPKAARSGQKQPPPNASSRPCRKTNCSTNWRIKILYALMERECSVGDIANVIGATQSAVSHQLRLLKQAHLVKFRRDGKSVIYSLADSHVYTMLAQGLTHICE